MTQGQGLDKEHFEAVFQANIDKLKERYPDGYETKKSVVRLKRAIKIIIFYNDEV